jgi:hypothetical protein
MLTISRKDNHLDHRRRTVVISLNIIFALMGITIAVVPGVVATHMMSLDDRGRSKPETTVSSDPVQLGSCPYCDEVLAWLVPLPTLSVAVD